MRTWFSFATSYCHSISHSIIEKLYKCLIKEPKYSKEINSNQIVPIGNCFVKINAVMIVTIRQPFLISYVLLDVFDSYSWSSHYFTLNILIILAFVMWLICNKPFRLQLSLLWRITSLYYAISKFIMDVEEYNIKSWVASFWWIYLEMYKKYSNQ